MKIKLHIGAHKTATTYMQKLLETNRSILLKEKILDLRLKIEHYEEEYKFLKKHTKPSGKEKISDFFYGDEGVVKRLDKLKNNLLNQNEKDDFLKSHSDDLYDGLDDVDVTEEYENLKSELKK